MKRIVSSALPALILCIWATGCVGVVPMRQRTVAQQGPTANISVSFLKKGATSRAEVLDKLRATDTGFASDRFFVGRWRTSKSGEWAAFSTPAGYGGIAADRRWHNANLLVRFDGAGAVESFEVFPDKLLIEKLAPVAQEQKLSEREQLETSLALNGTEIPVNLVLSEESVEVKELARFTGLKHRPQYHYTVPRQDLQTVTVSRFQDNATYLDVSFHFVTDLRQFDGPRGKKLTLQMTVRELIRALAYASKAMPKP